MADKTNVQRLPAEELFRGEIDALIANETHPVPTLKPPQHTELHEV